MDTDAARHGHGVCDLIANGTDDGFGMAPMCKLHVAKVWDGLTARWEGYELALDWAITAKAEVINLSFAADNISGRMKDQLRLLDEAGCICVAAYAGGRWPGVSPHVVPVGPSGVTLPKGVLRVDEITCRVSESLTRPTKHASYAAAIVSGVAACAKAWNPGFRRQAFLTALGGGPGFA